jgi:hypothetical protein
VAVLGAGGAGRVDCGVTDLCKLPERFIGANGVVNRVPSVAVAGNSPGISKTGALRSIPIVPTTQRKVNLPARAIQRIPHRSILLKGKLVRVMVDVAAVFL